MLQDGDPCSSDRWTTDWPDTFWFPQRRPTGSRTITPIKMLFPSTPPMRSWIPSTPPMRSQLAMPIGQVQFGSLNATVEFEEYVDPFLFHCWWYPFLACYSLLAISFLGVLFITGVTRFQSYTLPSGICCLYRQFYLLQVVSIGTILRHFLCPIIVGFCIKGILDVQYLPSSFNSVNPLHLTLSVSDPTKLFYIK
jgi:hypothetical protein